MNIRKTASVSIAMILVTNLCALAGTRRSSYVESLEFASVGDFANAAPLMRDATHEDRSNLDAWKMRIWLSTVTKNEGDALETIRFISTKMTTDDNGSPSGRRRLQMANYLGQIMGFMEQASTNGVSPDFYSTRELIAQRLNDAQRDMFAQGFQATTKAVQHRMNSLQELRQQMSDAENVYRDSRLSALDQEKVAAMQDLESLEAALVANRKRASEERNIHAMTRSRESAQSSGAYSHHGVVRRGRVTRQRISNGSSSTTAPGRRRTNRRVHAWDNMGAFHHGFESSSGLNDVHYADVNRREAETEKKIERKLRLTRQRLARIDREMAKLIRTPSYGTSAFSRAEKRRAESLSTYVRMPVDLEAELKVAAN